MKLCQITPEFVNEIPHELDPGKLYICCRYRAVKHLCACGCGVAVNTPLHPTSWTLICDGVSVSLWPSIGNWGERCQSHYWIRNSRIQWAPKWSTRRIKRERKMRELELDRYFGTNVTSRTDPNPWEALAKSASVWDRLKRLFARLLRRS